MAEAKAREVTKPLKIRLSLSSRFDKTKKEQPAAEEKKPEPVVAEPEKKRKRKTNYSGMMPKQIFTGFYSDNNKKLKRTVYDGALRIPPGTIELVRNAIKDVKEKALDGPSRNSSSAKWISRRNSRSWRRTGRTWATRSPGYA